MLSVCVRPRTPFPASPTDGFTSEGEILEISDIQRGQAGEYECITHNGVNSAPDSRRVLVTVNCEHQGGAMAHPGYLGRRGLPHEAGSSVGIRIWGEEGVEMGPPKSSCSKNVPLSPIPLKIPRPSRM